jgi:hypothetical protein
MIRKLFLLLVSILVIVIILVPTQSDYFQRLEDDFGETHHSVALDKEMLKEMGEFEYRNKLVFSQFDYSFGKISVSYYGFFNLILFRGSRIEDPKNNEITV